MGSAPSPTGTLREALLNARAAHEIASSDKDDPSWLTDVLLAYTDDVGVVDLPAMESPPETVGFLDLVNPLIARAVPTLVQRGSAVDIDIQPMLVALLEALRQRLLRLVERTLVLEMHAARLREQLEGDDPQQRYRNFVATLSTRETQLTILSEYPLLARSAAQWVSNWLRGTTEVVERLAMDMPRIIEVFGDIGTVTDIRQGESDPHHGGRHVHLLEFSSGAKLVYKPRSLAVDETFQQFVSWFNDKGFEPALRVLNIVDSETHGWMEFAAGAACESPLEVERFFKRQGAWLVVMWALAGTDLHFENMVASGEHPVPIDLETLLHARVFETKLDDPEEQAQAMIDESIIGVGLLPTPQWDPRAAGAIDMSGMGAAFEDATLEGPTMVDVATDNMQMGIGKITLGSSDNVPTLNGELVSAHLWGMVIEQGFIQAWEVLERNRDELLAPGGLLEQFASARIRIVIRPTWWYASLLSDGYHPQLLQRGVDRDEALDVVSAGVKEHQLWRVPFLDSERKQLWNGDVPYFSTSVAGRDVFTGDEQTVENVVVHTGFDMSSRRLQTMGSELFERNLWMIRASLATKAHGIPIPGAPTHSPDLIATATAVGERIAATAITTGDQTTWLGLQMVGELPAIDDAYKAHPIGHDLYDGLAGVALFLATLARETGDSKWDDLAMQALRHLQGIDMADVNLVGAYSGWAGRMYLNIRLAELWEQPELLDEAEKFIPEIAKRISLDDVLDIIVGVSSAIPVLLELHKVRPQSTALQTAIACGKHLAKQAPTWDGLNIRRGYSHGLTGISWALTLLADATADEKWFEYAQQAVEAERAVLGDGVWTDHDSPGSQPMAAWCHGAAGIALGRFPLWMRTQSEVFRAEIVDALNYLWNGAPRLSAHSLCHGDLGNLETISTAARIFPDDRIWTDAAAAFTQRILEDINTTGWRCAPPRQLEVPGLMNGLAGIGYGLLRQNNPGGVPSVLALGTQL